MISGLRENDIGNAMGKLSHKADWGTPIKVYENICKWMNLDLKIDVCATAGNAKCKKFITPEMDFFKTEIKEDAYANFPYLKSSEKSGVKGVDKFIERLYHQHVINNFNVAILLFTITSSSKWFQKYFGRELVNRFGERSDLLFYPERIQFLGQQKGSPPMSSFVLVWRKQEEEEIERIRENYFGSHEIVFGI